jgi:hypothetical protein
MSAEMKIKYINRLLMNGLFVFLLIIIQLTQTASADLIGELGAGDRPERLCVAYNAEVQLWFSRNSLSTPEAMKNLKKRCRHFEIDQVEYQWSGVTSFNTPENYIYKPCEDGPLSVENFKCAKINTTSFLPEHPSDFQYGYSFQSSVSTKFHLIVLSQEGSTYYITKTAANVSKYEGDHTGYYRYIRYNYGEKSGYKKYTARPNWYYKSPKETENLYYWLWGYTDKPFFDWQSSLLMGTFAGTQNTIVATKTKKIDEILECAKIRHPKNFKPYCIPFPTEKWERISSFPENARQSTSLASTSISKTWNVGFSVAPGEPSASSITPSFGYSDSQTVSFNIGGFSLSRHDIYKDIGTNFKYEFSNISDFSSSLPWSTTDFNFGRVLGESSYKSLDINNSVAWRYNFTKDECNGNSDEIVFSTVFQPTVSSIDFDYDMVDNIDSGYTSITELDTITVQTECVDGYSTVTNGSEF